MIFWAIAGVLLLAAVLALLTPLVRRRVDRSERQDHGIAVFREQLAELERDRQGGRIDDIQAESARIEIERRILAESETRSETINGDSLVERRRRRIFVASTIVIFLVPAATLGLYVTLGTPGLPDAPLADRAAERTRTERMRTKTDAHKARAGRAPARSGTR